MPYAQQSAARIPTAAIIRMVGVSCCFVLFSALVTGSSPTVQSPPVTVRISGAGIAEQTQLTTQVRTAAAALSTWWSPPRHVEVHLRQPDDVTTPGLDSLAAMVSAESGQRPYLVVNAQIWPLLTPVGQQVVLRHELVHLAWWGRGRVVPPAWVREGVAQVVAYAGTGAAVPVANSAGGPPSDADFAATNPQLNDVYARAATQVLAVAGTDAALQRDRLRYLMEAAAGLAPETIQASNGAEATGIAIHQLRARK